MRIRKAGKIRNGLWCLGRKESCVYLIEDGDEAAIISGGMSYILPDVLHQLSSYGFNIKNINKFIILHAHFDHIGIVPFFWRSCSDLEIILSKRANDILHSSKAILTINDFNKNATKWVGKTKEMHKYDLAWRDNICCKIVNEGDTVNVGNYQIIFYNTPGHSSCSITAYIPQIGAIFPSDAGGIPINNDILTSGNSNYTLFQESLEKINQLPIDIFCADHYGYITGQEAKSFPSRAIDVARQTRVMMENIYLKNRNIYLAAKELASVISAKYPDYVLPPKINEAIQRQMLQHISKGLSDT